jgi:hypothetical protein
MYKNILSLQTVIVGGQGYIKFFLTLNLVQV